MPTPVAKLGWSAYLARHLAGQARFPFADSATLAAAQHRRVRAMVRHAYRTVPFYRESMDGLGLQPDAFDTAADLARLPIVERERLQRDLASLTSTRYGPSDGMMLRTGGSTGAPRAVQHSTRSIAQNAAHGERERVIIARAVGRQVGYRESVIASPHSTAQAVQSYLRAHILMPRGVRVERQYLSVLDPVATTAAALASFAPHVVHGYGSYLTVLFAHVRAHLPGFPLPRVVTFSSDGLGDPARRLIRDELGVHVLGTYQSVEAFKIGFECGESEGLHLNTDLYPVRIVDSAGRDVPAGQAGDLVVSNLVNDATVLLNYRLGDQAALLPGACRCGRTLPRLSQPLGRLDDWVCVGDGVVVHSQALRTIFTEEREILQYQVVQRAARHFTVALVTRSPVDEAATSTRIATRFQGRLGSGATVDVRYVEDLPRTALGKVRAIIPLADASSAPPHAGAPS